MRASYLPFLLGLASLLSPCRSIPTDSGDVSATNEPANTRSQRFYPSNQPIDCTDPDTARDLGNERTADLHVLGGWCKLPNQRQYIEPTFQKALKAVSFAHSKDDSEPSVQVNVFPFQIGDGTRSLQFDIVPLPFDQDAMEDSCLLCYTKLKWSWKSLTNPDNWKQFAVRRVTKSDMSNQVAAWKFNALYQKNVLFSMKNRFSVGAARSMELPSSEKQKNKKKKGKGTNVEGTNAEGTNVERTNAEGTNAEGTNAEGTNAEGTNAEGTNAQEGTPPQLPARPNAQEETPPQLPARPNAQEGTPPLLPAKPPSAGTIVSSRTSLVPWDDGRIGLRYEGLVAGSTDETKVYEQIKSAVEYLFGRNSVDLRFYETNEELPAYSEAVPTTADHNTNPGNEPTLEIWLNHVVAAGGSEEVTPNQGSTTEQQWNAGGQGSAAGGSPESSTATHQTVTGATEGRVDEESGNNQSLEVPGVDLDAEHSDNEEYMNNVDDTDDEKGGTGHVPVGQPVPGTNNIGPGWVAEIENGDGDDGDDGNDLIDVGTNDVDHSNKGDGGDGHDGNDRVDVGSNDINHSGDGGGVDGDVDNDLINVGSNDVAHSDDGGGVKDDPEDSDDDDRWWEKPSKPKAKPPQLKGNPLGSSSN